jgi:hypothetical protein
LNDRDTRDSSDFPARRHGSLRAARPLMRDPAKGRLWMIIVALVFMVVLTFLADRWMHG